MNGIVWVTGASSGIGRATARAFAERGWRVAATARRAEALDELARETNGMLGDVTPYPGDVCDQPGVADIVQRIESDLGPIGCAILNAGTHFPLNAIDFNAETLRRTLELNVMGTAHGLEHLIPRMVRRGSGRIYLVASIAGYGGMPTAAAYGASKAALINLAEALHVGLAPHGITVGVVNPGFVRTPLTQNNRFPMPFLMPVEKAAARLVDGVLDGRFEIAFPTRLAWLMKLVRALPYALYFPLVERATRGRSKAV